MKYNIDTELDKTDILSERSSIRLSKSEIFDKARKMIDDTIKVHRLLYSKKNIDDLLK